VSLFRLIVTCAWAVSLGVFLVFLEAERVRMEHAAWRWEKLESHAMELQRRAVYRYWCAFQEAVPDKSLLEYLRRERERRRKCDSNAPDLE